MSSVIETINNKDLHLNGTLRATSTDSNNKHTCVKWKSLSFTQHTDKDVALRNNLKDLYNVSNTHRLYSVKQTPTNIAEIDDENSNLVYMKENGEKVPEPDHKKVKALRIYKTNQNRHAIQNVDPSIVNVSQQRNFELKVCESSSVGDIIQKCNKPAGDISIKVDEFNESEAKSNQTKSRYSPIEKNLLFGVDNVDDLQEKVNNNHKKNSFQYSKEYELDPHDPEFIDYCLHKYYRLNSKKWKHSSPRILKSLKKKYKSIRLLFNRDVDIMLKRIPDRNVFTALGQVKSELNEEQEKCPDVVNDSLVDPRVKSLSKALETGRNGQTGIEKTFKSCSVKSSKSKLKRCSVRQVRKPKWSLDPDWHVNTSYKTKYKSKFVTKHAHGSWKIPNIPDLPRQLVLTNSKVSDECDTIATSKVSSLRTMSEIAALNIAVEQQRKQLKHSKTHKTRVSSKTKSSHVPSSKSNITIDEIETQPTDSVSNQGSMIEVGHVGEFCIEICRDSPVDGELGQHTKGKNIDSIDLNGDKTSANKELGVFDLNSKDKSDCCLDTNVTSNKCSEIFVEVPSEDLFLKSVRRKKASHESDASLTVTSDIIPNLYNIEDECLPEIDQTELSPPILKMELDDLHTLEMENNETYEDYKAIITTKSNLIQKKASPDKQSKTHEMESDKDNQVKVSEMDDYVIYRIVSERDPVQNKTDKKCNDINTSDNYTQQLENNSEVEGICSNTIHDLSKIEIIDVQGNADHIMDDIENQCGADIYVVSTENIKSIVSESIHTDEEKEEDTGISTTDKDYPKTMHKDDQEKDHMISDTECSDDSDATDIYPNVDDEILSDSFESNTLPTMPMELNAIKEDQERSINIKTATKEAVKNNSTANAQTRIKKHKETVKKSKNIYRNRILRILKEKKKYALKSLAKIKSMKGIKKKTVGRRLQTKQQSREIKDLGYSANHNQETTKISHNQEKNKTSHNLCEFTQKPKSAHNIEAMQHQEISQTLNTQIQDISQYQGLLQSPEMTTNQNYENQERVQNKEMLQCQETPMKEDKNELESHLSKIPECAHEVKTFKRRVKTGQRKVRRTKSATNTNKDQDDSNVSQPAKRGKRGRFFSEQEKMVDDTPEERLMRDFPKHNWLFNKYSNSNSVDNIFKRKQKQESHTDKGNIKKKRNSENTKHIKDEINNSSNEKSTNALGKKEGPKNEAPSHGTPRESSQEEVAVDKKVTQTAKSTITTKSLLYSMVG